MIDEVINMAQRFEFNEEHDELEDMPLDYQEDDSD